VEDTLVIGGGRGSRRQDLPVKAEINVTSLVDVAFTLLVIFIIIAPALQGGVEIEVPRADVSPITADQDAFYVTVDREDRVYIAGTEVELDAFETSLPQMMRAAGTQMVYIQADSLADYGPVLRVIATVARTEGITFALVGEPLPERR
jgi:biopolymer transport protein TolR